MIELFTNDAHPLAIAVARDLLLMTRRQVKGVATFGIVLLCTLLLVWLVYRLRGRRSTAAVESEPTHGPAAIAERARPIDPAVANILSKAGARDGDTRTIADLKDHAIRLITELGGVSVPALQRKLEIDFAKASDLVAALEGGGFVSAAGAGGKRKVLSLAYEHVERIDAEPLAE